MRVVPNFRHLYCLFLKTLISDYTSPPLYLLLDGLVPLDLLLDLHHRTEPHFPLRLRLHDLQLNMPDVLTVAPGQCLEITNLQNIKVNFG